MPRNVLAAGALCAAALLCSSARGQLARTDPRPEGTSSIPGSGTVKVPLRPTSLRMQITLQAYGKTSELAMDRLEQRKKSALSKLKKIGLTATVLKLTPPAVNRVSPRSSDSGDDPFGGPAAAPVAPGGAAPPAATESPEPKPVPRMMQATTTLQAEWPLAGGPQEQMVAAAESIKEKIDNADLAGLARPQKLTPEERDALEELTSRPSDSERRHPRSRASVRAAGVPEFLYVAAISSSQRKDALARAFADAKRDAAELADATGARLGKLVAATRYIGQKDRRGDDDLVLGYLTEVTSGNAGDLTLAVQIDAIFQVIPADK